MEETKHCPYCGEEILAIAKKCKYCGEWLDKEEPIEEKKTVQCPVCGEDIMEGTVVCPYCHERIGEEKSVEQPRRSQEEQTVRPVVQSSRPSQMVPDSSNMAGAQDVYGGGSGVFDAASDDEDENKGLFDYYYVDVFFRHYADFNGKLPLKRFWMAYLFNVLCMLSIAFLDFAIFGFPVVFTSIYGLALLVPSIAFCVRRLHDAGKSGWYYLLGLVPFFGPIILLVMLCQKGEGQTQKVYAVKKDYVAFAIIGVVSLLFCIIGLATLGDKISEMEKSLGDVNPYSELVAGDSLSVDDEEWGDVSNGDDDFESNSINMIDEFYRLYWRNGGSASDDVIESYCTVRLQRKLRDAYPYDTGETETPYWDVLFRSGAQDGAGENKLVQVKSLGDGVYRVDLLDMGHECEMKIKVVDEDGRPMMNDVECVSVKEHW